MATLKDKNVLVTGGAGFIGSHLCDSLLEEPLARLIAVDNLFLGKERNLLQARRRDNFLFKKADITNFRFLKNIIEKFNIDVIFHLAVIPIEVSLKKPKWCFDQNVAMTQNICEVMRTSRRKIALVAFSSSEVYGSAIYTPMDEKHPLLSHTPYAASKTASDLLIYSYYKTFGMDMAIVRPFNNYGPRQNEGSYAGVIPLTIKRICTGQKPVIYGDGKQTRDFIFVTDTVKWTIEIFKNDRTRGEIINLASGRQTAVETIIKGICQTLNYKGEIKYQPERPGDVRTHEGSVEKAKKLLNFESTVDFSKGIERTIQWYREFVFKDAQERGRQ